MIRMQGIGKHYDLGETKIEALDNVNLELERGEYVSIVGPSGSGKSTLMHILGILDYPTEGLYSLEGWDVVDLSDKEQARIRHTHFGFIFQSFNLFSELSAIENVMLPMSYAGMPYQKRKNRARDLLSRVGLEHRLTHLPSMLSGGEQQRVAIARAIANEPDLILADEPTGNLPSDKGEEILEMLENLNREGVCLVMVTHNMEQARRADRCISLSDGRISGDITQDGKRDV